MIAMIFLCIAAACGLLWTFIVGMAICRVAGIPWFWSWILVLGLFAAAAARVESRK